MTVMSALPKWDPSWRKKFHLGEEEASTFSCRAKSKHHTSIPHIDSERVRSLFWRYPLCVQNKRSTRREPKKCYGGSLPKKPKRLFRATAGGPDPFRRRLFVLCKVPFSDVAGSPAIYASERLITSRMTIWKCQPRSRVPEAGRLQTKCRNGRLLPRYRGTRCCALWPRFQPQNTFCCECISFAAYPTCWPPRTAVRHILSKADNRG